MRAPLYLRYVGVDPERESEIPLEHLGRSLLGFDRAIKDLTQIVRLNGEIEIRAVAYSEGSLIVDAILELKLAVGQLPFESIDHLLEYLQLAREDAWREAVQFFNEIQHGLNSLNDYFAKRPFDLVVYAYLISKFMDWIGSRMNRLPVEDEQLRARVAKELQAIIKKDVFSDALRPLIEASVSAIEVSADRKFGPAAARIDPASLGEYLNPESQILPDLHDGREYTLQGEITSLKATRGESLTFQYWDSGKIYNLDAVPERGKSTKDYVPFYKERVNLTAEVERTSYFRKPKLHIRDVSLEQRRLTF